MRVHGRGCLITIARAQHRHVHTLTRVVVGSLWHGTGLSAVRLGGDGSCE